ncbi:MAG: hypothetical protein H8E62_09430 [Planctomycetes bacterium]|nr:hypothetical protein [Planctomycetota bacterium]
MNAFSRDVDLMKFEPAVFGSWFLSSQVLCGGDNGIVAGTQFTASGVDFIASGIQSGSVIWLQSTDGAISGAFEIVAVLDAGHLTVSVVRVNDEQSAAPVGSASGLTWRIVSYAPQGYEVLWHLSQRLGLSPGYSTAEYSADDIVNADSLRQASVFGILTMIFQSLYEGADGQDVLDIKGQYYRMRFAEAIARVQVKIDTDTDGDAEQTIQPGVICLVRK